MGFANLITTSNSIYLSLVVQARGQRLCISPHVLKYTEDRPDVPSQQGYWGTPDGLDVAVNAWLDGINFTVADTVTPEVMIGTTVAPEVALNTGLDPGPLGSQGFPTFQQHRSQASSNGLMGPPGSFQVFQDARSQVRTLERSHEC